MANVLPRLIMWCVTRAMRTDLRWEMSLVVANVCPWCAPQFTRKRDDKAHVN